MQETQVQSLGLENPLEKGMATHSSIIIAWRISWTEEPGRLQSMELQRVGHNWATKHMIYSDHQKHFKKLPLLQSNLQMLKNCLVTVPLDLLIQSII